MSTCCITAILEGSDRSARVVRHEALPRVPVSGDRLCLFNYQVEDADGSEVLSVVFDHDADRVLLWIDGERASEPEETLDYLLSEWPGFAVEIEYDPHGAQLAIDRMNVVEALKTPVLSTHDMDASDRRPCRVAPPPSDPEVAAIPLPLREKIVKHYLKTAWLRGELNQQLDQFRDLVRVQVEVADSIDGGVVFEEVFSFRRVPVVGESIAIHREPYRVCNVMHARRSCGWDAKVVCVSVDALPVDAMNAMTGDAADLF